VKLYITVGFPLILMSMVLVSVEVVVAVEVVPDSAVMVAPFKATVSYGLEVVAVLYS
jgi:hypothetical protein